MTKDKVRVIFRTTYNERVSVDTLCVVRPSPVVWVHPPSAVRSALAVRLPYTPHTHTGF